MDAFEDNHYLYLILEFGSGGCLHQNHCNCMQNKKFDIWTLGITFYEMLHSDRPFLILKPSLSVECKSQIKSILEVETSKRPSTTDILQSTWWLNDEHFFQIENTTIQKEVRIAIIYKKWFSVAYGGISSRANNESSALNSPLTQRYQQRRYSKNPSPQKLISQQNKKH